MTGTVSQLWGTMHGVLNVDFLRSRKGEDRAVQVTDRSTLCFVRADGETIQPAADFISDGQSIPIALWWLLGMSPLTGKSREASIIHDWLCKTRDRTYQEAARVMLEIMRSRGMWFRGPLLYRALLIGGSKW